MTVATTQKVYSVVGLQKFSVSLIKVWQRIRADDPYAEMVLIEIERRIDNAFSLLHRLNREIDDCLAEQLPGITLDIYQSKNPATIALNAELFATTHAKLGARLIGLYDLLSRKLRTGKDFGVINKAHCQKYHYKSSKALRGVFSAPLLYKRLGVTRNDLVERTEKGIEALDKLGLVPDDIINRTRSSQFGPSPNSPPRNELRDTEHIGA